MMESSPNTGLDSNKYLRFARYVEAVLVAVLVSGLAGRFSSSTGELDFSSWNSAATVYHALGLLVFIEVYIVQCLYHEDLEVAGRIRVVPYKPYHLFFDLFIALPFAFMGILERASARDEALLLLVAVALLLVRQLTNIGQIPRLWGDSRSEQRQRILGALALNIVGVVLLSIAVSYSNQELWASTIFLVFVVYFFAFRVFNLSVRD